MGVGKMLIGLVGQLKFHWDDGDAEFCRHICRQIRCRIGDDDVGVDSLHSSDLQNMKWACWILCLYYKGIGLNWQEIFRFLTDKRAIRFLYRAGNVHTIALHFTS